MILVTGATGTVGRELVLQLRDADENVRVLVRHPETADLADGVEAVRGDLVDVSSWQRALDGVDAAFLVWPFMSADKAGPVVSALAERVPRIVYLSAEAVAHRPDGGFWGAVEREIAANTAEWTFLRPTGFAKNTLMWAEQIKNDDVVRWPFANAARSLIHEADIARVAVRALVDGWHAGRTYVLSGPESLTQAEQIAAIGAAIGRSLRFEEIPPDEARPGLVAAFGDEAFVDSALRTWESFIDDPEIVTDTVAGITGNPATTLQDWADQHATEFR